MYKYHSSTMRKQQHGAPEHPEKQTQAFSSSSCPCLSLIRQDKAARASHFSQPSALISKMRTPSNGHDGKPAPTRKLAVIYAAPGAGHLLSTVELGKLLTAHGLQVIVVLSGQADHTDPFLAGVEAANPSLFFHRLPLPRVALDVPKDDHVAMLFGLVSASNPDLRDFLRSASPAVLVLDFFCCSAIDVGAELGIPTYFFFTSCIASVAFSLYHPVVHGQSTLNLRDLGGDLVHAPGLRPIPADHLPAVILDRNSLTNKLFLGLSEQMCNSQGLIVNSCRSLEPRATDAIVSGLCTLPGRRTPPLYCIGPLVKPEEVGVERSECLAWLDGQPNASVVFLCFGSLGRFSAEQTKQVAHGLEKSGQRFVWVVRQPGPPGDDHQPAAGDLDALFPEGFLHRTKNRGLVVASWAPQREVLAHAAVGGFVTHCGWNSVLEAVMAGVPMLAWPLYAEQRMNAVLLVEEMQLAVPMEGYDKEMVEAEEVSEKVRWLMESDGGRELRERTRAAMRRAEEALSDGGESRTALLHLVRRWKKDSDENGGIIL